MFNPTSTINRTTPVDSAPGEDERVDSLTLALGDAADADDEEPAYSTGDLSNEMRLFLALQDDKKRDDPSANVAGFAEYVKPIPGYDVELNEADQTE